MPKHWHFVVQLKTDTKVTEFFRWMTQHPYDALARALPHRGNSDTEGTGHLYQGRFKTFPVEEDEHLLTVLRYVERNALQAKLVERADQWKFVENDKGRRRNSFASFNMAHCEASNMESDGQPTEKRKRAQGNSQMCTERLPLRLKSIRDSGFITTKVETHFA